MEKKQNSAVNKVEEITAHVESGTDSGEVKELTGNKTPVYRTKTTQKKVKTVREDDGAKREQLRVERDRERIELKEKRDKARRLRAERQAKELEERRQTAIRRREEIAAERARLKEERIARRDYLKNESDEARRERIARERQEQLRLKGERAEIRARLVKERREKAERLKTQKREQRARDRRDKRSRGVGGWIAAVVSLGCATLLLGTLFTFNLLYMSDSKELLNNAYSRAYYDLAGCVDNIDVNLSKLEVSYSPAQQQKLLTDIVVQSELAESELQSLPIADESRFATGKYINQLGDYAKTLSYKLADGGEITEEDRELLSEFYRRNSNLQSAISKASAKMGKDFSFLTLLKPEEDNVIITNMNELENNSLEYPKMIYDGPFSDGLETGQARGLSGSEITKKQALQSFRSLFADYGIAEAEVVNCASGRIETYNVEARTDSGSMVYAQMAKRGGRLVLFNCYEPCTEEKFTLEECREIAEVFVKKAGFEGMIPVWETSSRAVAQFNFACEQNGVILYPDLVKVNVCMQRGVVSAVEASSYCLNHVEREIPKAVISASQAEDKASAHAEVIAVRKAIVPVGNGKEALSYEVYAQSNGKQYFIYVDALTGKQLEVFEVIESSEGRLLI